MPKRKTAPGCATAGHICPNPQCKKANKKYRSLSHLRRHLSHQKECLTYHVSESDRFLCSAVEESQRDIIKAPEKATANVEQNSDSWSNFLPSVDFHEKPDADDYETGLYSEDDGNNLYDKSDYLIVPKENITYTNDMRVEVSLLRLCNNMDAPLWAFEQIMEWAHDALSTGYQFIPQQSQYDSQIHKLQKWLNMEHI
jgi:hypothetical protein